MKSPANLQLFLLINDLKKPDKRLSLEDRCPLWSGKAITGKDAHATSKTGCNDSVRQSASFSSRHFLYQCEISHGYYYKECGCTGPQGSYGQVGKPVLRCRRQSWARMLMPPRRLPTGKFFNGGQVFLPFYCRSSERVSGDSVEKPNRRRTWINMAQVLWLLAVVYGHQITDAVRSERSIIASGAPTARRYTSLKGWVQGFR